MGYRPLGRKWFCRIERTIGEPIWWAAGNGGYWHWFVTMEHRHGDIHAKTLEVAWDLGGFCHTSCAALKAHLAKDDPDVIT